MISHIVQHLRRCEDAIESNKGSGHWKHDRCRPLQCLVRRKDYNNIYKINIYNITYIIITYIIWYLRRCEDAIECDKGSGHWQHDRCRPLHCLVRAACCLP